MKQEKSRRNQNHGKVPAYLIDPPSPFGPRETWEKFLRTLESFPQDDPIVQAQMQRARKIIAEKKAEEVRLC